MRLGLIARADEGGLGRMTYEFYRHMQPDATLVVLMGPLARGPENVNRYGDEPMAVPHERRDILPGPWDWIASRCDVVYTAEVPYSQHLVAACRQHGTRLVVHAMPELLRAEDIDGADVWLPTWWRVREVEKALNRDVQVIPVPVALDRFAPHPGYSEPRLLHVAAPAMLDRSGTDLLAAALRHVSVRCTIVAVHAPNLRSQGVVTVEHRAPQRDYWRLYDDVSALIAPRRYGGLSLVAQEAAAAGLGALVLDREPDRLWPGTLAVPTNGATRARMAGGTVPVEQASAQALASGIDRLAADAGLRARLGVLARGWAAERSWTRLGAHAAAALSA